MASLGLLARRLPAGRLLADGLVLAALLAWFLASQRTPEYILPHPKEVLTTTLRLFFHPSLMQHTYISLLRVVAAVAAALVLGGGLVALARLYPVSRTLALGRVTPFLNAFPTLGWAVMAVFWFGVSNVTVLFVEVAILLPFCIINLAAGVAALDEELLEMGRSFTRGRWRIFLKLMLPMLAPYILASVRISYGVAWKVALIAELFGADRGLGYLLNFSRSQFDSTTIFAIVLAIIVLVFVVDRLVLDWAERYTLRYKAPAT
jgi:NitT/TauT family transport system permease protein/sulfonate transport system permease protein